MGTRLRVHVCSDAAGGDNGTAVRELTDRHRRELQLHCYRILGALQDAEDVVQETLLAAWRNLEAFEGRASVRSWLYRIATNRCLDALRARSRRPREVQSMDDSPAPTRPYEPVWLEAYPDVLLDDIPELAPGPDARYEARESVELAFIVALQRLPPRQRAALVLCDVLGFRTAEIAEIGANTQPALGCYLQDAHAAIARPFGLIVLTLEGDRISAMTRFDASVFPHFGLPRTLRISS